MRSIWSHATNKSKISNFWAQVLIEEDVACFNVSVDDFQAASTVKIRESLSSSGDYVKALLPIEDMGCIIR